MLVIVGGNHSGLKTLSTWSGHSASKRQSCLTERVDEFCKLMTLELSLT